jgi:hypothetical protein
VSDRFCEVVTPKCDFDTQYANPVATEWQDRECKPLTVCNKTQFALTDVRTGQQPTTLNAFVQTKDQNGKLKWTEEPNAIERIIDVKCFDIEPYKNFMDQDPSGLTNEGINKLLNNLKRPSSGQGTSGAAATTASAPIVGLTAVLAMALTRLFGN